jgi:hypothetical protein
MIDLLIFKQKYYRFPLKILKLIGIRINMSKNIDLCSNYKKKVICVNE